MKWSVERTVVQMGELSSARQALEGAEIAPGLHATLQALTNEDRRPAIHREPLPQGVIDFIPAVEFSLEDNLLSVQPDVVPRVDHLG